MYAQVEKSKENKSRAVANSVTQRESNMKQGFGFVDNRKGVIQLGKNGISSGYNKHIKNRDIPIRKGEPVQLMSSEVTGAYVGYTYGGEKPTLYFQNGHITQVHGMEDNVGWHNKFTAGNVNRVNLREQAALYMANLADNTNWGNDASENVYNNAMTAAQTALPAAGAFRLFEIEIVPLVGGDRAVTHVSRSDLVLVTDPAANPVFDNAYANEIRKWSVEANNENIIATNQTMTQIEQKGGVGPDDVQGEVLNEIMENY